MSIGEGWRARQGEGGRVYYEHDRQEGWQGDVEAGEAQSRVMKAAQEGYTMRAEKCGTAVVKGEEEE